MILTKKLVNLILIPAYSGEPSAHHRVYHAPERAAGCTVTRCSPIPVILFVQQW